MASPAVRSRTEVPANVTTAKKLRTPGKGAGDSSRLVVPKLKLAPAGSSSPPEGNVQEQDKPGGGSSRPARMPQAEQPDERLPVRGTHAAAALGRVSERAKAGSTPAGRAKDAAKLSEVCTTAALAPAAGKQGQRPAVQAPARAKGSTNPLSSPDYSPKKRSGHIAAVQPAGEADVPLACHTAISKRRYRHS